MNVVPQKVEGAGKAGCSASTRSLARNKKAHERSRHRFAETIRPSLRNGLRLIPRSPRRPGFLATVARELLHRLDASVGASGPHGFAVRYQHRSSREAKASIASRPTFVTMANVP